MGAFGLARAQDFSAAMPTPANGPAGLSALGSQSVQMNPGGPENALSGNESAPSAPAGGGIARDGLQTNSPDDTLEGSALANAWPAVAQKLGVKPEELAGLRDRLAGGQLSPDDLQQLCLRFAARQLTPSDVAGIAHSLGIALTPQQLDQLQGCTTIGRSRAREAGDRDPGTPIQHTVELPPAETS
jgi:hypothetical protein